MDNGFPYKTFDAWYDVFKQGAAEGNPKLSQSADGGSLLDFMDHSNLRRAFNDMVEPRSLGRAFGAQFDLNSMLGR
jgi:hypothetical protein